MTVTNNFLIKKRNPVFLYLVITAGTGLLAFAIKCIFDPVGLVTGGFTGIAILVKALTDMFYQGGIPLWFANLALNIPFFVLAYKIKGKKFIGRTAYATVMLSVWLYLIPEIDFVEGDYILASIFGGVLAGIAMGMILWANATTGGTEMVAVLLQCRMKHYSVAQIMQVLDGMIVLVGVYVFGLRPSMYAIVAIFITSKVTDTILEGMKFSKAAYIITEHYKEIAGQVMEELNRGVTGLEAHGMYSGERKCVLYCVVAKKEIVLLKEIVHQIDENAFVIVGDVREVHGEGFIEHKKR
ncbi:MAG: YitT family protein [Lachnospiraceae bacterium]|nr:YitT family protein [Lachnospiraceae bacterium]